MQWVYRYDIRVGVEDVMRLGVENAAQKFAEECEAKALMLMLHCWASGLFTADGWTINKVEYRRQGYDRDDVLTMYVRNRITGKTPLQYREKEE